MKTKLTTLILFFCVLSALDAKESIRFARLFAPGMVLQREMPVPVWGFAEAGTPVVVRFGDQSHEAVTDESGRWQVTLAPLPASFEPAELVLAKTDGTVVQSVPDVLVGEVWVLAGQSNIDWGLGQSDGGKEAATDAPWLRIMHVGWQMPDEPAKDAGPGTRWSAVTPKTALQTPAIGFWFACELHRELQVPVGLVRSALSGTYGESWVSRTVLESIPAARPRLDEYEAALVKLPEETKRWEAEKALHEKAVEKAKLAGEPIPKPEFFVQKGPMGPNHFHRPYALFNGRIAPLAPMAARGIIWYQGEGNTQKLRVGYYGELLRALIASWRAGWHRDDLPFLIVQLPVFNGGQHRDWPTLRGHQFDVATADPHSELIVTIDTGNPDDIHPSDKKPVADRVARAALAKVYEKEGLPTGPLAERIGAVDGKLRVTFQNAGGGLRTRDEAAITGFEIAGKDGVFHPAAATVAGNDQIELSAENVPEPMAVRHAWADVPAVNLVNSDDLPAAAFQKQIAK
jgi:sialate O-acetylesterase